MRTAVAIALLVRAAALAAQPSPFNGREVQPPDSTGRYRIVLGGHFHGRSDNTSGYPAATLLANLDGIDSLRANLLICAGDLFLDPPKDTARYRAALFSKLHTPLFNARGNHDGDRGWYERVYGPTHRVFTMGNDRIVLLDTEVDDSSIEGEQLATLRGLSEDIAEGRVFIVSHRPVWAEDDPRYGPLFAGNSRSRGGTNYRREVEPLLRRMARRAQVFWIAGSMAGRLPAAVFFQPHDTNITFIQCAIRDRATDALLIADVAPDGVTWTGWSLTGRGTFDPTVHDAAWWRKHQNPRPPRSWRWQVAEARRAPHRPVFWYGAAAMLLVVLVLRRLWRRGL